MNTRNVGNKAEPTQMKESQPTLVFAVAGYNLAETGRMLEVAKVARNSFDILFLSYGGRFERLIDTP